MIGSWFASLFGSRNDRLIKQYRTQIDAINAHTEKMAALDEAQVIQQTADFKSRVQSGESLDAILPEAFALVREVSERVLGLRHYDVQLIGGMVLHNGKIAEMRTGEGKTLVATLPVYLNALSGEGVHVVTVNDYLAKRDAEWMRPVYEALGLSVGIVQSGQAPKDKIEAYSADVVYATNNELGFDYLRDNMAFEVAGRAQRQLNFAIVDEVDSILIDEARTPLIISGAIEGSSEIYAHINKLVKSLEPQVQSGEADGPVDTVVVEKPGDFLVDLKSKQVHLTEQGQDRVESLLLESKLLPEGESLYSPNNIRLSHAITAALRAHHAFQVDIDYIIQDNQVVIVDEHTGRTMPGRRWSEGLHQAVEAKEGVTVQNENQTLASITFQNFFRQYQKLGGMTGTADTEAVELQQIYGLEVVVVPTHRDMVRDDRADLVFLTQVEKYDAIIKDIREACEKGQPVLVGTASIESSEFLSKALKQAKIDHQVLNAKFHEKEAEIIAQAGRAGTVTIATNMAGRGTDIVLGGSLEADLKAAPKLTSDIESQIKADWKKRHDAVLSAGGLCVIGTERHESRRIDNQLRGRSGRQGDPGVSQFYLSLEDNLMRLFASDKTKVLMEKMGWEKGEAIQHKWVNRAIENAQRKVEARNFDIRKQLLEYDDVANEQRQVIYEQRRYVLEAEEVEGTIDGMRHDVIATIVQQYTHANIPVEEWDISGLKTALQSEYAISDALLAELPTDVDKIEASDLSDDDQTAVFDELSDEQIVIARCVEQAFVAAWQQKSSHVPKEMLDQFLKSVLLQQMDNHWREHLASMDYLRQGIHLRGYAQKNPKQEYKREAFLLFNNMLEALKLVVTKLIATVHIQSEEEMQAQAAEREAMQREMIEKRRQAAAQAAKAARAAQTQQAAPAVKIGRNDPCPCGSGKKYKRCHGQVSAKN